MEIFLTSIITFVSTNIDDIFILILFYSNSRFQGSQILSGQLIGIGSLVAISLIASFIGLFIDKSYIGLLGLIPIYLGIKNLWELFQKKENDDVQDIILKSSKILTIASVTFANGGDNLGIYIPLFATITLMEKLIMIVIFFFMTIVSCLTARHLTKHPYVSKFIDRYAHMVTPIVLILLGLFILHENESITIF